MAKKVDSNQKEIVQMLRNFGASVVDTHSVGKGCPDIFVGYKWKIYAFEIKSEGGFLTPAEYEWRENWKGNYYIVHNIEEALQILCDDVEDDDEHYPSGTVQARDPFVGGIAP